MSEGKEKYNRGDGTARLAWVISILIHLAVLGVFTGVRFSVAQNEEHKQVSPAGNISQARKTVAAEPVTPKPKVKKAVVNYLAAANKEMAVKQILDVPHPVLQSPVIISRPTGAGRKELMSLSSSIMVSPKVEFFGSTTECKKICYVVDCSGSMFGTFERVQRELIESIERLDADRYFYIIFFASDELYEYGGGRLIRASPQVKLAALDFILSVKPAGATNAAAAMERAMQICDDGGSAPAIVYFLTDGFELTSDNGYKFAEKILNVRKSLAAATKINTIGFWVQKEDGRILEKIARDSGGECILIND